jgi:hypothetical protein
MKADVKEKWIAALRSGKYRQDLAFLHPFPDGFCCLGVLCDVVNNGRWRAVGNDEFFSYRGPQNYESSCVVPCDLADELELTSAQQQKLSRMNDDGVSFEVIADYIERNL